jgi:hypothetical protein
MEDHKMSDDGENVGGVIDEPEAETKTEKEQEKWQLTEKHLQTLNERLGRIESKLFETPSDTSSSPESPEPESTTVAATAVSEPVTPAKTEALTVSAAPADPEKSKSKKQTAREKRKRTLNWGRRKK